MQSLSTPTQEAGLHYCRGITLCYHSVCTLSLLLGYAITLYCHSRGRNELLSWDHFMLPFCMYSIIASRLYNHSLLLLKRQDWSILSWITLCCHSVCTLSLLLGCTITLYSTQEAGLNYWRGIALCCYSPITAIRLYNHSLLPLKRQDWTTVVGSPYAVIHLSLLLGCTITLYSLSRGRTEILSWDHFMLPFCMYSITAIRLHNHSLLPLKGHNW